MKQPVPHVRLLPRPQSSEPSTMRLELSLNNEYFSQLLSNDIYWPRISRSGDSYQLPLVVSPLYQLSQELTNLDQRCQHEVPMNMSTAMLSMVQITQGSPCLCKKANWWRSPTHPQFVEKLLLFVHKCFFRCDGGVYVFTQGALPCDVLHHAVNRTKCTITLQCVHTDTTSKQQCYLIL